jgi:hypothetical protein
MRFHILSCFLRTPCILSHFGFLALLVLFMIFLLVVISCHHELSSVCFWGTPKFKKGIGVIVHLHIVFMSLQMLLSLRIHLTLPHQLQQILLLKCFRFLYLNRLFVLRDLHSHRVVLSFVAMELLMNVMSQFQKVLL